MGLFDAIGKIFTAPFKMAGDVLSGKPGQAIKDMPICSIFDDGSSSGAASASDSGSDSGGGLLGGLF